MIIDASEGYSNVDVSVSLNCTRNCGKIEGNLISGRFWNYFHYDGLVKGS